jgi:hypothetical protein
LALLHPRFAVRSSLHAFSAPQALPLRLLPCCLAALHLGLACGLLALHLVTGTLTRLGVSVRIGVNAIRGDRRLCGYWRSAGVLALLDIFKALGCAFLALSLIPHRFTLAQQGLGIACVTPCLAQAVFHRKTLVASGFGLPQSLRNGFPLFAHGLASGGTAIGVGAFRQRCGSFFSERRLGPGRHGHECSPQDGQ